MLFFLLLVLRTLVVVVVILFVFFRGLKFLIKHFFPFSRHLVGHPGDFKNRICNRSKVLF